MTDLSHIPTADLEAEITRRREAERLAALAERVVIVLCPWCGGSKVFRSDGYGPQFSLNFSSVCQLCSGTGRITATRVP